MIRKLIPVVVALVVLVGAVEAAEAQQRPRAPVQAERERDTTRGSPSSTAIPRQYMPPPGMCRIWLKDVPAAQQPAPTDCATAIRKRPANGRVVFGERRGESRNDMNLRRDLRPRPPATPPPSTPPLLGMRIPGRSR